MIQPALVLPSNAPLLRDDDNVYEASRILQEHSGNRQHHDLVFSNDVEVKYSDLDENIPTGALPYQQLQPPPFFPALPLYQQGLRLRYGHGGYRCPGPEDEARIRADADRLYSRLCKMEGYVKYRGKQGKDGKGGDQKWPTHLEKAFCRALVQYPPMGRRKQCHKKKPRGRNELIADCIFELTGQLRTRKQISSHIQVLKPWVEHDAFIMKWMSKDSDGKEGRNTPYTVGRRISNYPVQTVPLNVHATMPTLARSEFQKIRMMKRDLAVFQPVDFQMFVQQNYEMADGNTGVKRLHTYTSSITHPLGEDVVLNQIEDLRHGYPLLASMHSRRPFDCTVLDAEASLAFPIETWKNKDGTPLPGVELGIYFLCVSAHLPATPIAPMARDRGYQVVVHNTFYENGICAKEHSGSGEARIEASERGSGYVETRIKFGSTFWAKTLGRLASRLLDKSQDHSEEVGAYLRGINAVQEVVAVSEYGVERLLVIHWKFRQSTGVRGRTSWRRISAPSSQQMDHPPPILHSSLTASFEDLGTHVDEAQPYHPPPPALQSPFEYDSSSGSTLSSATWSGSFDENNLHHQHHHLDPNHHAENTCTNDNIFDFTAGNINVSYDETMSFDHFDSSAFNFDVAAAASADFAADPALNDYSSHQWYTNYSELFDAPQAVTGGTENFGPDAGVSEALHDENGQIFSAYGGGGYDEQHQDYAFTTAAADQDHRQASQLGFGAEGGVTVVQDGLMKDGDALAALADASYMARALQGNAAGEDLQF